MAISSAYAEITLCRDEAKFMPFETNETLWVFFLVLFSIQIGAYALGGLLRAKGFTKKPVSEIADILVNIVYLPWVIYFVVNSILVDIPYWTVEGRWLGASKNCQRFAFLYALKNIFRVIEMLIIRKSDKEANTIFLYVHHLLTGAVFGIGCWTRCLHFFGMLDALCEISSVPLNILKFWRVFEIPKDTSPYKYFYVANGIFLWITYVFFRILLFPMWMVIFLNDWYHHPEFRKGLNLWEKWSGFTSTVFLFIVSCIWFGSITRGLIRAVMGPRNTNGAREEPMSSKSNGSYEGEKNGNGIGLGGDNTKDSAYKNGNITSLRHRPRKANS